jgi:hypothetical protein
MRVSHAKATEELRWTPPLAPTETGSATRALDRARPSMPVTRGHGALRARKSRVVLGTKRRARRSHKVGRAGCCSRAEAAELMGTDAEDRGLSAHGCRRRSCGKLICPIPVEHRRLSGGSRSSGCQSGRRRKLQTPTARRSRRRRIQSVRRRVHDRIGHEAPPSAIARPALASTAVEAVTRRPARFGRWTPFRACAADSSRVPGLRRPVGAGCAVGWVRNRRAARSAACWVARSGCGRRHGTRVAPAVG